MKTSNKILLGFFLGAVVILTSMHLALYAKIKSGDFVSAIDVEKEKRNTWSLPSIKYVFVTGLANVHLLTSYTPNASIQPELKVDKQPNSKFAFRIIKDTLYLLGDSTANKDAWEQGQRNYQVVSLSLPVASHVKVDYGSLRLFGGLDSAHAPSYSIELARHAYLSVIARTPAPASLYFNRLDLVANASNVELYEGTTVNELNVQSRASTLVLRQATFGHIALDVDSVTTVTTLGKNLRDISIISQP